MRGDGKGVGWPGPWPSTVPITWANLGVGDEDVLQIGVALEIIFQYLLNCAGSCENMGEEVMMIKVIIHIMGS